MTWQPGPAVSVFAAGLFEGSVAVVTGGGSGLGREVAHAFARLGGQVVIAGRTADRLDEVAGTIEREEETKVFVRISPLAGQMTTLNKPDIVRREASPISPMPPGLLNVLTENQILDLLAYLESGGDPEHADFKP